MLVLSSTGRGFEGGAARAIIVLHGFAVAFGALVVQGPILKGTFIEPFGLKFSPNIYWLWALLLPLLTMLVAMGVAALVPGLELVTTTERYIEIKRAQMLATQPDQLEAFERLLSERPPSNPLWLLLQAVPLGMTFNAILGLVEELGWRGFVLNQLSGSFWRRSLLIGAMWGIFMVPVVSQGHLFPGAPVLGSVLIVGYAIAFSPMLVWVRLRSGSVITAALLRGMLFALTNVGYDLVHGEARWLQPLYGVTGIVAAGLVTACLVIYEIRLPPSERVIGSSGEPIGPG